MGILQLVQSKGYKKFMGYLYGWGAAVVIVGALFKINHYTGANFMLILGMSTEAIIFIFSSFEPLHDEVDWKKVYPELREDGEPVLAGNTLRTGSVNTNPLASKMDEMFENAKISPELFERLGLGLQKLSETTNQINGVVNVVTANNEYASELQKMTGHLSKLNDVYLNQMQTSSEQMAETQKLHENMSQIMEQLGSSLEDAKKYRSEVNELSQKVAALSAMYGKMLTALSSVK